MVHDDEAWPTPQTSHLIQFCTRYRKNNKTVTNAVCLSVYLTYLGQAVHKRQQCSE